MLIVTVINTAFDILIYLIIARSLISFIPHDPYKPVFRFIYEITEPMLKPFRRFSVGGGGFGLDFSPLIAIFLLMLIHSVLLRLLSGVLY